MEKENRIRKLEGILYKLYIKNKDKLLFHGWHHINFVRKKSIIFAKELNANVFLVEAAALTDDLNYLIEKNSHSKAGEKLRDKVLKQCDFSKKEIEIINKIIKEEEISTRTENISSEAKALSDADTLFKALPITVIFFTSKYITENNTDICSLAKKIIKDQKPLLNRGIYFYSKLAKAKYLKWAQTNIQLWENMQDAFEDKDIVEVLNIARSLKVI